MTMDKDKIPTAKEFFDDNNGLYAPYSVKNKKGEYVNVVSIEKAVEFAKMIKNVALKAAAENAKWSSKTYDTGFGDNTSKFHFIDTDYAGDPSTGYVVSVDKSSILNAYPDKLIK